MSAKVFAILFVVFVLYQTTYGATTMQGEKKMARGMSDKIKEALNKLKSKVQQLILKGVEKLSTLNLAPELDNFLNKLTKKTKEALEMIEALKDKAQQNGININDCVKESQDLIKEMGVNTVKEVTSCATDKIKKAENIITSATNKVKKSMDEIEALLKKFTNCGHGISSMACYGRVSKEIASASIRIPNQIQDEINQAVRLVTNIKQDLKICIAEKSFGVFEEIAGLVQKVADCYQNKI